MPADRADPCRPPARWELGGVALLALLAVAFGVLVEYRTALAARRMGDLGVFLRAAWAVRSGADLYEVTCDNRWHYNYPPLLAVVLAPLADPPRQPFGPLAAQTLGHLGGLTGGPWAAAANAVGREPGLCGAPLAFEVPYAASAAVCYALNVLCLAVAVHWLARAAEETSADPRVRAMPRFTRRWWLLRCWPVWFALPPIGHTLMRGQVNLLLLLLVAGMILCGVRAQRFRAGLYLAGAVCLKIFPAYLLLVPLWRRDGRALAGCAAGLLAGLVLVPVAAMGPGRTADAYVSLARVLIGPALGVGDDTSRADELIHATATNNHAFVAALHTTLHPEPDRRPRDASPLVRKSHWALGAAFTLLTLIAAGRRPLRPGADDLLLVGALALVMLLTSPVCHSHYFVLAVPAFVGLLARAWEDRPGAAANVAGLTPGVAALVVVNLAGNVLPLLPGCAVLRDLAVPTYTTLAVWAAACWALWRPPLAARAAGIRIGSLYPSAPTGG